MSNESPPSDSQLAIHEPKKEPETVRFHNLKSTLFRVVQADGMWCSVNPHENVHLVFFNERAPVPQEAVYKIREDGGLGEEIQEERKVRDGYIRELEVDVVLTKAKAGDLYQWLGRALGFIEEK